MSYPTFSLGAYAVPNFKTLCLYVTGYLQIGTHLNIQSLQLEVHAGFREFTAIFQ